MFFFDKQSYYVTFSWPETAINDEKQKYLRSNAYAEQPQKKG